MILQNQIKCKKCGDTPYSTHYHDFVDCECGAVAVDGGLEYLRRVGAIEDWEEMSVQIPDAIATSVMDAIKEVSDPLLKRNELGVLCAIARNLRDNGYSIQKEDT